jgi:hypothetical protein
LDFQCFASKRNKRINAFFASKRKLFCIIFASFRLNRKRTAHPNMN